MARRRRLTDEDLQDDEFLSSQRRRRRGGRRWRLLLALAALAACALAAPAIIAKSPLRNIVLERALPAGAGKLTARDAAFSWTGRQALAGVVYVDAQGATLFSADLVECSRSLIGLATNGVDLGKITLTRPVLQLNVRADGSNIEDVVDRFAEAAARQASDSPPGASTQASMEIEIIDGSVVSRDLATGQQWRIDRLSATAKPAGAGWDVAAAGEMLLGSPAANHVAAPLIPTAVNLQPAGEAPSELAAEESPHTGRFKLRAAPIASGEMEESGDALAQYGVQLIADRLPLAPIEPWLARALPSARITGDASADLSVTWTATSTPPAGDAEGLIDGTIAATGKINAANFRFTSAALAGDLIELTAAAITLDATIAGDRLSTRQCTARGDWFQAELDGEFHLEELSQLSLKSLPTSDATITAQAELPQLTRMLPRTLRLRPGVRVDAGSVEVTARSAKGDAGRQWTVAAALQDLVGSDGQRPIRWTKPVEAGVDVIDSPAGPQFQRALFRAAFATAAADGTAGGIEGELQFNLDELAEQLGQFVDLSAWRLQGTGSGQFSLRDNGADRFAASADLDLRQIDVRRDGKIVWQDPQLRVELQAAGDRQTLEPRRIETATATVRGPSDALSIELLEPIDWDSEQRTWFLKIAGNGPLELWAGRLRPWVAGVPEELAGQATVGAQLRAAPGLLQVVESTLSVKNFQARVGQTRIAEPGIEATGDFRWDAAVRLIESKAFQMSSGSIAFGARDVSVQFTAGAPTARGDVAFRGDFDRIAAWGDLLGAQPGGLRPRGQFVGRLQLASDANRATATLSATAEPLQLINSADGSLAWNEPRIELATEAAYSSADDRLRLSNVRVSGQTVRMDGSGVVEQLRTSGLMRGDATISYDAAELAKLLTTYLGPNIQITGANQARLQATGRLFAEAVATATPPAGAEGFNPSSLSPPASSPQSLPHWSRRWELAAETGWSAANVFGLPIGPAQIVATVRDGQAQCAPLELTVGQTGRISLTPRVTLDADPQALELAPGQAISNVAISAEVSDRMLKYAAPIVAGAARAEGSFSFFLNQARIPLRHPKQGRLEGRLTVHDLSVTPGPLIQDIASLIRQIDALGKNGQNLGQIGQNLNQGLGGLLGGVAPQKAEPLKGITMSERAIDVTIADGRVYHRNLEFLIDDVPVRSQGSVGFDETLNLLIEVPIQQKWIGRRPALQSLVGQVIQIPVSGTFAKPRIDSRAIGAFAAQAAQQAAGGLLGEELNKAFDKILKPR